MSFPELVFLENLIGDIKDKARIEEVARIPYMQERFPIYTLAFGSKDPRAPTLALVGGVHGQEKIGSQVVLTFLETMTRLLDWDDSIHQLLEHMRIVFLPIANPVGMFLLRRGNGNRVDLMRNGPFDGPSPTTFFLGGQRVSKYLPWYRGVKGAPMELESQVLCDFIQREVFPAKVSIALDVHSGFGAIDRLWFPYSHTIQPYPQLAEAYALKTLLDETYPNHVYRMEPTAQGYTISGDLWDYLYLEHQKKELGFFFPMTLEMGSWLWLKKNPAQIFSSLGLFHPMHLHRHKRILRRHLTLFDFLQRATVSSKVWTQLNPEDRAENQKRALDYWYYET